MGSRRSFQTQLFGPLYRGVLPHSLNVIDSSRSSCAGHLRSLVAVHHVSTGSGSTGPRDSGHCNGKIRGTLFLRYEDGFGYFPTAAVGRSIAHYEFVRKLGWAASSTVWLALDRSRKTTTFAAIKILTSQATAQIVEAGSPEYLVYRKIETTNPKSPGFNHCLTLRHCFTAESPAGYHICFVTEPLSLSLANLRHPGQNRFTLPTAKRIIRKVLFALDYLHRECGYIHTDSRIYGYIKSNPPSIYGPPLHLKSLSLPLVFSRSHPLPYSDLGGILEDLSVRLVDYSEATPIEKPDRSAVRQPAIIRAPEVTLKYPWTCAIDIWTVGCLLFELLTERPLFNQDPRSYSDELHLQNIAGCLGPFPSEFLLACEDRNKFFDDKGMLLRTNMDYATTLEDILRNLHAIDEGDIPGTAAFLRKCLALDPKLRPGSQELLRDDWLRICIPHRHLHRDHLVSLAH